MIPRSTTNLCKKTKNSPSGWTGLKFIWNRLIEFLWCKFFCLFCFSFLTSTPLTYMSRWHFKSTFKSNQTCFNCLPALKPCEHLHLSELEAVEAPFICIFVCALKGWMVGNPFNAKHDLFASVAPWAKSVRSKTILVSVASPPQRIELRQLHLWLLYGKLSPYPLSIYLFQKQSGRFVF